MKILLIAYQFGGNASGIMSYRVASELECQGHDVFIVTEYNHVSSENWNPQKCLEVKHIFSKQSIYNKIYWHISQKYKRTGIDNIWCFRTFIKAFIFAKSWRPDWIYCRSSPIHANIIGGNFAKFGYNVLQHFADPFPSPLSFYREAENREQMKSVVIPLLKSASLVSMGNDAMMAYMLKETGVDFSSKSFVSPDPAPYDKIEYHFDGNLINNKKRHITYLGEIYASRNPQNLFDAIFNINQRGGQLFLSIFSDTKRDLPEKYSQYISWQGRKNNVKTIIEQSDILVDLDGDEEIPVFISSKLKDYLCSDVPVLSITPINSPSNRLLQNLRTIKTVQNRVEDIQSAIEYLLNEPFTESDYAERITVLHPFVKKNIVEEIISQCSSITGKRY